jgi:hypothetical protein
MFSNIREANVRSSSSRVASYETGCILRDDLRCRIGKDAFCSEKRSIKVKFLLSACG